MTEIKKTPRGRSYRESKRFWSRNKTQNHASHYGEHGKWAYCDEGRIPRL